MANDIGHTRAALHSSTVGSKIARPSRMATCKSARNAGNRTGDAHQGLFLAPLKLYLARITLVRTSSLRNLDCYASSAYAALLSKRYRS